MAPGGRAARTGFDMRSLDVLVCPVTRGPLAHAPERDEFVSRQAGLAYPVRAGVVVLIPSEARRLSEPASET